MSESTETDNAMKEMLDGKTEQAGSQEEVKTSTEANASENTQEVPAQESTEIDWKAESRKWEERAKANKKEAESFKASADRVSELEQELEKAKGLTNAEIAEREQALEKANLEVTRYKVAAKYGVSEEDVELFLTASDEETLIKQAQRISQHSANAPKPDPAQGKRGSSGPSSNADAFAAAIAEQFTH